MKLNNTDGRSVIQRICEMCKEILSYTGSKKKIKCIYEDKSISTTKKCYQRPISAASNNMKYRQLQIKSLTFRMLTVVPGV